MKTGCFFIRYTGMREFLRNSRMRETSMLLVNQGFINMHTDFSEVLVSTLPSGQESHFPPLNIIVCRVKWENEIESHAELILYAQQPLLFITHARINRSLLRVLPTPSFCHIETSFYSLLIFFLFCLWNSNHLTSIFPTYLISLISKILFPLESLFMLKNFMLGLWNKKKFVLELFTKSEYNLIKVVSSLILIVLLF